MLDPEIGFLRLLEELDRLEIHYMVTGSAASSSYGVWRATNDIALVIDLAAERVGDFVAEFQAEFYLAEEQIRSAITHRRSFNLIHLGSFYKFDLFPLQADRFQKKQFSRRIYESAAVFGRTFVIASAEDAILSELGGHRVGGEVSENQWTDILGILAQQRGKLDLEYLREWAPVAEVADLLEKALAERHGERGTS